MKIFRGKTFKSANAWGSNLISRMNGITTKIHWTDKPYKWHLNDGQEVFVVLDGEVDMYYKESGAERCATLRAGDIFYASIGLEHSAHPRGEARVLVVEAEGSD